MRVECGSGFLLYVLLVAAAATLTAAASSPVRPSRFSVPFNRTLFPSDFVFGAGIAAYQVHSLLCVRLYISLICVWLLQ